MQRREYLAVVGGAGVAGVGGGAGAWVVLGGGGDGGGTGNESANGGAETYEPPDPTNVKPDRGVVHDEVTEWGTEIPVQVLPGDEIHITLGTEARAPQANIRYKPSGERVFGRVPNRAGEGGEYTYVVEQPGTHTVYLQGNTPVTLVVEVTSGN